MKLKLKLTTNHGAANFKHAVSSDDLRPAMHGVGIDFKNKKLFVTDAHVLVSYDIECDESDLSLCLPVELFDKKLYDNYYNQNINMSDFDFEIDTDKSKCYVLFKGEIVCARRFYADGKYPDANSMFKDDFTKIDCIGIDSVKFDKISKAIKLAGLRNELKLSFAGKMSSILVEPMNQEGVRALLMPLMLND